MSKLKALLRGMFFILPVEKVAAPQPQLHTVMVNIHGDLRVRKYGEGSWIERDTINHPSAYEHFGIPLRERVLVSDRPFPGAHELERASEGAICTLYGSFGEYLSFCDRTLNLVFGHVPETIYWRKEDEA